MEKSKEKEFFRLWWEYLKRSQDYKDFCKWMRQANDKSSRPRSLLCRLNSAPRKFQKTNDKGICPMKVNFIRFMDVHAFSFNEWWNKYAKKDRELEYETSVVDYGSFLEEDIEVLIEDFKNYEGREPTLHEFKVEFLQQMTRPGTPLLLMVTGRDQNMKVLVKSFRRVVSQYRQGTRQKIAWDELKRYLMVYQHKVVKELKWREAIPEIQKITGDHSDRQLREWQRDKQKAEVIIKNVEQGIFPGKY